MCLIWGTEAETGYDSSSNQTQVRSARAGGAYCITRTAKSMLSARDSSVKARLTTWIVEQHRLGEEWPLVTSKTIQDAENRTPLSVGERADNLLRFLESKSDRIGAAIQLYGKLSTKNEALAQTESVEESELEYLGEHLKKLEWIKSPANLGISHCSITPNGYARLDEIRRTHVASEQAFIAMWFDETMGDAYENGIAAGVEKAGYKPVRIDRKPHNGKIDDEIIAEIRRSRFLVADFTQGKSGARGGVYYEAGFAHGLNIPVIFTCRKDALENVHFDTRQYNHIVWETADELCRMLSQRISATIGDGPLKKK